MNIDREHGDDLDELHGWENNLTRPQQVLFKQQDFFMLARDFADNCRYLEARKTWEPMDQHIEMIGDLVEMLNDAVSRNRD